MTDDADLASAVDAQEPTESPFREEARQSVTELVAATGGSASAAFVFHHKVFAVPGARFAIDRRARATMFYIRLGNLSVSLTPTVLRREFNIAPHSHDSRLIELADKALRYVKEVRPGDSIPTELIDGTASWSIEDRHRLRARAKLLAQVGAWSSDNRTPWTVERVLAEDPVSHTDFQLALAAVARELGLDEGRRHDIVAQIDTLARELGYIEALRDHVGQLHEIRERVLQLACAAKGEQKLVHDLTRTLTLLKQPVAEFADSFAEIDAQSADLMALLRGPWFYIKRIRDRRDELHASLMPWSETFERWRDQNVIFNAETQENVQELLRWLAAHYSPKVVWQ